VIKEHLWHANTAGVADPNNPRPSDHVTTL
jgi:hypothetical protein